MTKIKYTRLPKYDMGGIPGLGQLQQAQAQIGSTLGDAMITKGGRDNAAANIGGNVFKGAMSGTGIIGAGLGLVNGIMDFNKAKREKEEYEESLQRAKNLQEAQNFQQNLKNNLSNIPTFALGGNPPVVKTKAQLLAENPNSNALEFYKTNPLNSPETYNKLIGNPRLRNEMYNLVKGYTNTPNDSTRLFTAGVNEFTVPYEDVNNEPVYESSQGLRNAMNKATQPMTFVDTKKLLKVKADGGDLNTNTPSSNQPYIINYKGASHANGGIAVNSESGNPTSITGEEAGAEVEGKHLSSTPQKGEIAVKFRNSESPYIFSDKLGFAKQAAKIQKKYSLRPNDKISQDSMYQELEGLMDKQEEVRTKLEVEEAEKYAKGGWIQKAHLKKGRCTPAPNPDCPVGSRQYNLAMTFKKHHGFHENGGDLTEYALGGNPEDEVQANADRIAESMRFDPNNTLLVHPENYVAPADQEPIQSLDTPYTGQVSPLGALSNMAGNAILMATNKKAPGITAPYINPQHVDLSQAREAIRNNAIYSRANRLAALRGSGLSQAQYAGAIGAIDSDLNRGVNEGISQSYLSEQGVNAGYNQQANLANAQNSMQVQQYNAAVQDRYNKEQQEYLSNLLNTPVQYLNESQKAQRDALLIQTQSPNVKLTQRNRSNKLANLLLGPQSVGLKYGQ